MLGDRIDAVLIGFDGVALYIQSQEGCIQLDQHVRLKSCFPLHCTLGHHDATVIDAAIKCEQHIKGEAGTCVRQHRPFVGGKARVTLQCSCDRCDLVVSRS